MHRLIGMCGLSFSGKTTLAKAISQATGAGYVSLDDINKERGLFGGEGIPVEEWEKTSLIAVERIEKLLMAGRDVVLDDTLCFRWLRDRYAAVAERYGAEFVLIFVSTPLPVIREAMACNELISRRNSISTDVFEAHASGFEWPAADEHAIAYDRKVPVNEWIVQNLMA